VAQDLQIAERTGQRSERPKTFDTSHIALLGQPDTFVHHLMDCCRCGTRLAALEPIQCPISIISFPVSSLDTILNSFEDRRA
jgi:hypothetical protein